ncbi:MAG: glycosyltransferase family 2 protein [Candidatus Omnitrophota bacterium]|nr:glycosyltransferase family 2 protein [Candidatus Omnitrophota bacterium]
MKLSIVTTLYCSAPYLEEFYSRVRAEAEKITSDFEIILTNDGSPDNSLDVAISIQEKDSKVRVIDLSRNFGHHKAIMTGLAHTSGETVFLIDCDLEEAPELLGLFERKLQEVKADVVYGVQKARKGNIFEKITGAIFYHLINFLSTSAIPKNVVTARFMSRRYVDALVQHKDREIFLAGLWAITGFRQVPVTVEKRDKGKTTYNLALRISAFVNAITSFSSKPLVYIFYIGAIIFLASSVAALYLMVRRVFFGIYLAGWPSLIVSIWLLGGLTIFCVGLLGIYLSKVYMETKDRPYTIVRQIYEKKGKP